MIRSPTCNLCISRITLLILYLNINCYYYSVYCNVFSAVIMCKAVYRKPNSIEKHGKQLKAQYKTPPAKMYIAHANHTVISTLSLSNQQSLTAICTVYRRNYSDTEIHTSIHMYSRWNRYSGNLLFPSLSALIYVVMIVLSHEYNITSVYLHSIPLPCLYVCLCYTMIANIAIAVNPMRINVICALRLTSSQHSLLESYGLLLQALFQGKHKHPFQSHIRYCILLTIFHYSL